MKRVVAKKSFYELRNLIGTGLTSQVYRAFRVDSEGLTKQEVALKIIKSKNDVQILKREFENLSRVKSKHCVGVLAWENLTNGHSLVLEYIDGVTLKELIESGSMNDELVREVLVQVRLGLLSLHKNKVFHGDLNLKNIMVNSLGVVKLIDFGFGDENQQFLTPQYAAPSRLAGAPPTATSDFYGLNLMAKALFNDKTYATEWQCDFSRQHLRKTLREKVQIIKAKKTSETLRVPQVVYRAKKAKGAKRVMSSALFFVLLLTPSLWVKKPHYGLVNLRSKTWVEFSLNGLPFQYGPFEKKLRHGTYKIHWVSQKQRGLKKINVEKPVTFLLKPEAKTL